MQPQIEKIGVQVSTFDNPAALAVYLQDQAAANPRFFSRMARLGLRWNERNPGGSQLVLEITSQPVRVADKAAALAQASDPSLIHITAIQAGNEGVILVSADDVKFEQYPHKAQLAAAVLGSFKDATKSVLMAPGIRLGSYTWAENKSGFVRINDLTDVAVVPSNCGGGLIARGVIGGRAKQVLYLAARKLASNEYAIGNWQIAADMGSHPITRINPRVRDTLLYVSTDNGMEALNCSELGSTGVAKRTGQIDTRNAGFDFLAEVDSNTGLFGKRTRSGEYATVFGPIDQRTGLATANLNEAIEIAA